MKCRLISVVLLMAASVTASADQGLQTAKVVSVKKHAQGRIVSWSNHAPIFDDYPFYNITLEWNRKQYVARYESMTGYYPKAGNSGRKSL